MLSLTVWALQRLYTIFSLKGGIHGQHAYSDFGIGVRVANEFCRPAELELYDCGWFLACHTQRQQQPGTLVKLSSCCASVALDQLAIVGTVM